MSNILTILPTEIFLILCYYLGIKDSHKFFLNILSSYLKVLLYGGQIELAFTSFASLKCNWRYCLDILQEDRRPFVENYKVSLPLSIYTNLLATTVEKPTSPKIKAITTSGKGISQLNTIQKDKFLSFTQKVCNKKDQCDLTIPLIELEEEKFFSIEDIVEDEPELRSAPKKEQRHRYSKRQSRHDRLLLAQKDKLHHNQTIILNGEIPYSAEYESDEYIYQDYMESDSDYEEYYSPWYYG